MAAMAYDVVVIGAGIGGLACAAKLAGSGCRVLVLERNNHIGGTSYLFRRNGFSFPMGPLSFSFPSRVKDFLARAGVETEVEFRRNHFQLISPELDIVYSSAPETLQADLQLAYPDERMGLASLFSEFNGIIRDTEDIVNWHPDYLPRPGKGGSVQKIDLDQNRVGRIREYARLSSGAWLERHLRNRRLIDFLGSQGTSEPEMSVLTLSLMWKMMSEVGIWFPSCGIGGLSDLFAAVLKRNGGELRLGAGVEKILIEKGRAVGVRTHSGEEVTAASVVSNADAKTTFLGLCAPDDVPPAWLNRIENTPYTGSELCVYLGIEPGRVDWSRMRATHLFYRHERKLHEEEVPILEDFEDREFEICRWSDNAPEDAPPSKVSLILRVGFPYDHFARFRTGEKKRREDYRKYKMSLAGRLVATAEHVLPGLSSAVEIDEAATPLTYADWGRRYLGSIAGWSWSAEHAGGFESKLLVLTPVENLYLAGIYAATELFLGGVPTAVHTADLAARIILGETVPGAGT